MKRPIAGLAFVYAAGIYFGAFFNWPVLPLLIGALALIAVLGALRRSRYLLVSFVALVFVFGSLRYREATTTLAPTHITRLIELRDQNVLLRGTIISDTGFRDTKNNQGAYSTDERPRFKLRIDAIKQAGEWSPATGKLLVFVSAARPKEPLRYGDVIEFSAILRVPPPVRNPGSFDWRGWLARQNIQFTSTLRKTDTCTVVAHNRGNPVVAVSLRLRDKFERALRLGLDSEPRLAGVLAGMVIGERSEIPPDTYTDFQHTGVFHVFAISGLHVGLVTGVVILALRLARIPRRWCGLAAIPMLVLYVYATGARPGATRALVMACMLLIGWVLVRPTDLLNTFSTAALAILLWDPVQLFDAGFILSFTVVLAITVLEPRIEKWLLVMTAADPLVPRHLLPRWRQWVDSPLLWFVRLVSCSMAAWLGLLPLMALYFHLFTPISILANVLVVPMLGMNISLGMLSMLAYPVWPWLTLTLNNANFFLLSVMIRAVDALSRVPYGHQFVQAPPSWVTAAYYAIGVLLLSTGISWHRRRWAAAFAVPAFGIAALVSRLPEKSITLTVLDLTDGVAMFLNNPGSRHDWLIDAGGDWSGSRVVLPFLRAQGVNALAGVVISRKDKAHVAGLNVIAVDVPLGQLIASDSPARSQAYLDTRALVAKRGVEMRLSKAGDEIEFGSNLHGRVLSPARGGSIRSDDNALVIMLEIAGTRVLLMSDTGESVEQQLVERGADLRAQIVVKGRHGKEQSCTDAFLDAVQPELVIQSVALHRSDRYFQPELRDRVEPRGIKLLRTDETGAVTIELRKKGYWVKPFLAAQ
jgi:competence protein ComEC